MASLFESLPPEMVQKCVEFLPFDELIERTTMTTRAPIRLLSQTRKYIKTLTHDMNFRARSAASIAGDLAFTIRSPSKSRQRK